MGVTFALRGTSLTAHRALERAEYIARVRASESDPFPAVISNSDSGVFGESVIDMYSAGARALLSYLGRSNISSGALTILLRIVPLYSGSPSSNLSFFYSGSGIITIWSIQIQHLTTGALRIIFREFAGVAVADISVNWSPTANQAYDIMISWDGSTDANAIKVSIEGEEVLTGTSTKERTIGEDRVHSEICFGQTSTGFTAPSEYYVNELVLFDTAENHVYTPRTDFYDCVAFDGAQNSDPGVANVRENTTYYASGVLKTGTLHIYTNTDPGVANVREGTAYTYNDSEKVGTLHIYTNTDPGIANVSTGTTYYFNDNLLTGVRDIVTNTISEATLEGQETDAVLTGQNTDAVLEAE